MVKTLVLVRHGNPEEAGPDQADMDRRLTRGGRRTLEAAYPRTFSLLGDIRTPEVWSSPAIRALETANIVADATGAQGVQVKPYLYAQDVDALLAEAKSSDAQTVIAVGHVPCMDVAARRLLGFGLKMGKGSAAAIELKGDGDELKGTLQWFVAGPDAVRWEALATVEREITEATEKLGDKVGAFLDDPGDVQTLLEMRVAARRTRSLLEFLEPWQARKQNGHAVEAISALMEATSYLRELDIFATTVAGLVESGELAENSLLSMACANERKLECDSLLAIMRKGSTRKHMREVLSDLSHFRWRKSVLADGLTAEDFQKHFDDEFETLDASLFGLDLHDFEAVHDARKNAKEIHYVANRLGAVLGSDRADASRYLNQIQDELGALCDAHRNQQLAEEFGKSPRFRGVRADLGVTARDQGEVVSAILSGLERREHAVVDEAESNEPQPAGLGAQAGEKDLDTTDGVSPQADVVDAEADVVDAEADEAVLPSSMEATPEEPVTEEGTAAAEPAPESPTEA